MRESIYFAIKEKRKEVLKYLAFFLVEYNKNDSFFCASGSESMETIEKLNQIGIFNANEGLFASCISGNKFFFDYFVTKGAKAWKGQFFWFLFFQFFIFIFFYLIFIFTFFFNRLYVFCLFCGKCFSFGYFNI